MTHGVGAAPVYRCGTGVVLFAVLSLTGLPPFESALPVVATATAAEAVFAPEIESPVWLNSTPLSRDDLRGKVVLVEFWTFGCWNCRNVEPYIKSWHARYAERGLLTIGVHAPEFEHERDVENVRKYLHARRIEYPVAIDNDFQLWRRFGNQAWPTLYLIDSKGVIRYRHIGEGHYAETEQWIQRLLDEAAAASGGSGAMSARLR